MDCKLSDIVELRLSKAHGNQIFNMLRFILEKMKRNRISHGDLANNINIMIKFGMDQNPTKVRLIDFVDTECDVDYGVELRRLKCLQSFIHENTY
jgi:hypothetical protein